MTLPEHAPLDRPFDSVLVISFGGPGGLDDVRPFLQNVARGRRIPPERIEEVARHYCDLFGGISPLTDITLRQARLLENTLQRTGPALPVHVGMRNWHPFLSDTLSRMALAGLRRAIGFIAAAHKSYSSCTQYKENVIDARTELLRRGSPDVTVTYVEDWYHHDGFIATHARHIRQALEKLPPGLRSEARIVFSAHSIPLSMADRCQYRQQLSATAGLIAGSLQRGNWTLVYQSRSGRPQDPWLEPDICDYLRAERPRGLRAVVISPIGFVCDHIEVLYDLDHQAADVCRQAGIEMVRAETPNDDPQFVEMMADVVQRTYERHIGGRILPIVPSVASSGSA